MLVTLLFQNKMYSTRLPEKVRGQYWIKDVEAGLKAEKVAEIVAGESGWVVKSGKGLRLWNIKEKTECDELVLQGNEIYPIQRQGKNNEQGYILTEPFTQDRCIYTKYIVNSDVTLSIGADESNQIVIHNAYVSAKHATLMWQNNTWLVYDNDSTNGIYVNNEKVKSGIALKCGDLLFILGCKIIVGNGFFAINNPDMSVNINCTQIEQYEKPSIKNTYVEAIEDTFYYRAPFFEKELELLCMKIEAPIGKEKEDETPILLTLAPSLLMGVASFSSGLITTTNTLKNGGDITTSIPTLLMSVSMLFGMVLFPFIMKNRDKRMKRKNEKIRHDKYLKYLDVVRDEIQKNIAVQEEFLREKYPPVFSRLNRKSFWDGELWGITNGQDKFLKLRVGTGNYPMDAVLSFPENRFSIEEDVLRNELEKLQKEKRDVKNVPICIDAMEYRTTGLVGTREQIKDILHNIFLQVAALYPYDELKLVFIGEERDVEQLPYLHYIPHIWDNNKKKRFLAVNYAEVRDLSGELGKILTKQIEEKDLSCHYLVVCTSKLLEEKCGALGDILDNIQNTAFHFIAAYERLQDLPGKCDCILQYGDSKCKLLSHQINTDEPLLIEPDEIISDSAMEAMLKIAKYRLDLNRGKYELPDMMTFLQMFKVGKYEHLNIQTRWKENNPVLTLRTPIGVDTTGSTFYLDMHEKAHGPHGLVAGMTGSGKSEFIITLILSLAVNYHPDEVAFILIDYKGGGLAGAFDNELYRLPHLAGTITNLDGSAIVRSLVSIQSELRRRQAVFNKARAKVNEGTMDIYKYQKLYREGVVKEPMPHLFIVSDEFAELKVQQPEFMEQLISAARIGRSLGVHLILATQKPSGVVNEQIWANSKFKVCLKVQDKADSNDMLKRPDAAEITETGRFYLQVGYNELFELGQSAWCGAPYVEEENGFLPQDMSVEVINNLGKVIEKVKGIDGPMNKKSQSKQIVEVLKYICDMAREESAMAKNLWLPPLPAILDCSELICKYSFEEDKGYLLKPVVGELDDPFNQSQGILSVPLSEQGNVVVYGSAGSGKNSFITTMLYSLYMHHDGAELNTYILDFGAEALQCFSDAPQTGEILLNGDDEKIGTLFSFLKKEVDERKKILREYGGEYQFYCSNETNPRPNILVIINNYSNFVENYEVYDEEVTSLTRDCSKYGIYFVITANTASAIRYKLQQNFTQCFVLQLNDKSDYFNVIGNTGGIYPSSIKGRGIVRQDKVYEFQTAYPFGDKDNVIQNIRRFCQNMASTYEGMFAKKIPVLSGKCITDSIREDNLSVQKVPYGNDVEQLDTDYFDFEKNTILQIISRDERDIYPYVQGMAEILSDKCHINTVVFDLSSSFIADDNKSYKIVQENPEAELDRLYEMTVLRHNTYKSNGGKYPEGFDVTPIAIIIPAYDKLVGSLSEDGQSKLKNMLLHMQGFFGMIAVVCDSEQAAARYYVSGWRKERCVGNGIYIGNDLGGQFILNVSPKYRNNGYKQTNNGCFGYMIQKGIPKQIQLLLSRMVKEED